MTLSSFSSTTSMSFSDLNVELGKGAETELSMSQAAAGFSGIITNQTSDSEKYLPAAMEIREFYGLTLGEIEATNLTILRLVKNTLFESWQNTEMIECAEGVVPKRLEALQQVKLSLRDLGHQGRNPRSA